MIHREPSHRATMLAVVDQHMPSSSASGTCLRVPLEPSSSHSSYASARQGSRCSQRMLKLAHLLYTATAWNKIMQFAVDDIQLA
jgi:hypothetical protein